MYTPIKRIIDIVLSGVGIIVLSPLLLVLCIAIKLDSPVPFCSSKNGWEFIRSIL